MIDQDLTTGRYSHLDLLAGETGLEPILTESKSVELTNYSIPLYISTSFRCRGRCVGEPHIIPQVYCLVTSEIPVFLLWGGGFAPIAFGYHYCCNYWSPHITHGFYLIYYTRKRIVFLLTSLSPWKWAWVYCFSSSA